MSKLFFLSPPGPPVPPPSIRVSDRVALVSKSSIVFSFNCSWFSDINGAVRNFTVVVSESEGTYVGPCRDIAALQRETLTLVR